MPPTQYAAVFNTTTFGCLQSMDILGLGFSPDNLCGICALSYDRATKVAIKFTIPCWRDPISNGGVSNTDSCISSVVYPSWDDGPRYCPTSAYAIIVWYSWAQDATLRLHPCRPTTKKAPGSASPHLPAISA